MNIITTVQILIKYIQEKPIDIYNPFKHSVDSKDEQNENFYDLRLCYGTVITYNNEYYILTCHHGIQNYETIHLISKVNNKSVICKLNELYSIKQYDFSVLRFDDPNDIKKINHELVSSRLKYQLETETDIKLMINYLPDKDNKDDNKVKGLFVGHNALNANYIGYNIIKFRTEIYPAIPIIEIRITDTASWDIYQGLSGALVYNYQNEIYGIISNYDVMNKILCVIPSYCLYKFFIRSIKKDNIKSLCLSTKVCSFDNKVGHEIDNTYNINYVDDKNKEVKFKKGDLIESINNQEFDKDGYVYIKDLNITVPLDTYCILEDYDLYKIKYYNKSKNYVETIKQINLIPLDNIIRFNLYHNDKIIKYRGLVITEMSEQLIIYYNYLGIDITGLVNDYYNDCYTSTGQKILVVINIDYNELSNIETNIYKLISFPLIKTDIDSYIIPVVSKINNKKINNINDMEKLLSNKSIIRFEFTQKKGLSIKYDDDKVSIKY